MTLKGTDSMHNRWLWMAGPAVAPPPVSPSDPFPGGPAGYTVGTQVCWNYNGRPHGYFRAAGNGERHILISFTDDAINSCANFETNAPQKTLKDAGINWNGRTVRAPGDTIVWEVLTIMNTNNYSLTTYANDIKTFFDGIYPVDTSNHARFHIMGIGGGVNRFWGYVVNHQSHNSPYRNIFSTTISMAGAHITANVWPLLKVWSPGRRHWVWYGTADTVNAASASTHLYDSLMGYKKITAQVGGTHGQDTWDSCLSRNGTDTVTNRWLWMVKDGGTQLMSRSAPMIQLPVVDAEKAPGIYPNPARGTIFIHLNRLPADKYTITITDMMGRIQKMVRGVSNPQYQLDVSDLRKGVYIIRVDGSSLRTVQKLMKE
jgi:hypothetical protein